MKKSQKHRNKKDKKHNRTFKRQNIIVPINTPLDIRKISYKIADKMKKNSYNPFINY